MTSSLAFNFELRKVEEIMPWGTGADRKLHWFGLTDGLYWISTPLGEVLQYTEGALVRYNSDCRYVDYQVARIFEDLQEIMPYALEPVPGDIAQIVSDPDWYAKRAAWFESDESSPELCERWFDTIEWWSQRNLDTLYLKHGPSIQIWRVEDRITIRWDSCEQGESVWTLPKGECSVDAQAFTSSCLAFLLQVLEEMQIRVDYIVQNGWLRQDCVLDIPLLVKEQKDRSDAVQAVKDRRPNTDWNVVREQLCQLARLSG